MIGFLSVVMLLIVTALFFMNMISDVKDQNTIINEASMYFMAVHELIEEVEKLDQYAQDYIIHQNKALKDRYDEEEQLVQKDLLELDQKLIQGEVKEHLAIVKRYIGYYNTIFQEDVVQAIEMGKTNKLLVAQNHLVGNRMEIVNMLGNIHDLYYSEENQAINTSNKYLDRMPKILIGVVVITFLLGFMIIKRISKSISKHLDNVVEVSKQLASGNLSPETICYDGNDEIGQMTHSINTMKDNIGNMLIQIERNRYNLEKSEERYRLIFEASSEMLWHFDYINGEKYFSNSWKDFFGDQKDGIIETLEVFSPMIHPHEVDSVKEELRSLINGDKDRIEMEARTLNYTHQYRWVHAVVINQKNAKGQVISITGSFVDIQEKRTQEEKIERLAYYDSLTGLPNRVAFYEKLSEELIKATENKDEVVVIFLDMDNFKYINDTFGPSFGDEVLKEIGDMFTKHFSKMGFIARLGGDEFVLFSRLDQNTDRNKFAREILHIFPHSFKRGVTEFLLTVSSGIAVYPDHGQSVEQLLKNADIAMYAAKELGKNQSAFYTVEMRNSLDEKLKVERCIKTAISRDEFFLMYQPQHESCSGEITGFEALLRWNSPELGSVSPSYFIPVAEHSGEIVAIGQWVLKQVGSFKKKLVKYGHTTIKVSINISPVQVMQADFAQAIKQIIKDEGIDTKLLYLEITESVLLDSFEENLRKLEELKAVGFQISLDDFGTGYSSLNYLNRMAISEIKIDKAFVDHILENEKHQKLTKMIIEFSQALGYQVVAEGVEKMEQLEILRQYKCDIIQGYLFNGPLKEADIFDPHFEWVKLL